MYEVIVEDKEVQDMLGRLLARTGDLSDPMEDIARLLANETEQAFLEERSPFGGDWLPLKSGRQGKILQDTGQLAASIDASSGRDYAELTAGKVYAAIHQFGGQAGRGRRTTIPARPFMPIDEAGQLPDDTQSEILSILDDFMQSVGN